MTSESVDLPVSRPSELAEWDDAMLMAFLQLVHAHLAAGTPSNAHNSFRFIELQANAHAMAHGLSTIPFVPLLRGFLTLCKDASRHLVDGAEPPTNPIDAEVLHIIREFGGLQTLASAFDTDSSAGNVQAEGHVTQQPAAVQASPADSSYVTARSKPMDQECSSGQPKQPALIPSGASRSSNLLAFIATHLTDSMDDEDEEETADSEQAASPSPVHASARHRCARRGGKRYLSAKRLKVQHTALKLRQLQAKLNRLQNSMC